MDVSFTAATRPRSPGAALKGLLARGLVRAGRRPSIASPRLDGRQPTGESPDWSDSFYFTGSSRAPDAPLAFFARLGFRPSRTEAWLGVWTPQTGLLELNAADAPATSGLSACGLSLECLTPGQRWQVTFDGALRAPSGEMHPVQLSARFEGAGALYDFEHGTPPALVARTLSMEPWSRAFFEELQAMHQAHVEQPGRYEVALALGGAERRATLYGVRDHSFGPRRWRDFRGHAWLSASLDDGSAFNVTLVRLPKLRHVLRGYLFRDGRFSPVTDAPTLEVLWQHGAPPERYPLWFVAGGRRHELEVRLDASHRYLLADGALAFHEGFASFTLGSVSGRGISEFSLPATGERSR